MKSIFQYRSIVTDKNDTKLTKAFSLINLERNQVYLSKVNFVNDPYEGIHNYKISEDCREQFCRLFYQHKYESKMIDDKYFNEYLNNIKLDHIKTFLETGISCFSNICDSLLMWGHYADSHQGICIEFDREESIFKSLIEVKYVNSPFTIIIDSKEKVCEEYLLSISENVIASKHKSWEYEQEFRLIGHAGTTYTYDISSIKAIYFGSKVIEKTICNVYYSSCHIPHLKYFYMKLDFENYSMSPIDITERCQMYAKNDVWTKNGIRKHVELLY